MSLKEELSNNHRRVLNTGKIDSNIADEEMRKIIQQHVEPIFRLIKKYYPSERELSISIEEFSWGLSILPLLPIVNTELTKDLRQYPTVHTKDLLLAIDRVSPEFDLEVAPITRTFRRIVTMTLSD